MRLSLERPAAFEPNMGMFIRPERNVESAWTRHIPFAGWLVEALSPSIIVELGTHHGASFSAMCQAVELSGINCMAYAVDTWQGDEHAGLYGDSVYADLAEYQGARFAGFSKLMRMRFDEALPYFGDGTVDLLHIDGLHTYEAVKHDFDTWLPKLSRRGVVLFHDTRVRERDFGVWRLWQECSQAYPSFEFLHGQGLGVLVVGTEVPAAVGALCGAVPSQMSYVNALFARLGESIDSWSEMQRLREGLVHARYVQESAASAELAGFRETLVEQKEALRQDLAHVKRTVLEGFGALTPELGQLVGQMSEDRESRAQHLEAQAKSVEKLAGIERSMEGILRAQAVMSETQNSEVLRLQDAMQAIEEVKGIALMGWWRKWKLARGTRGT